MNQTSAESFMTTPCFRGFLWDEQDNPLSSQCRFLVQPGERRSEFTLTMQEREGASNAGTQTTFSAGFCAGILTQCADDHFLGV